MKQFTAQEAYDYIKKNRITEFRLTEDLVVDGFVKIEKGEKLWFGVSGKSLSTYGEQTDNRNIGKQYDYGWLDVWHNNYIGKFELVEKRQPFPEYAMTDDGIVKIYCITEDVDVGLRQQKRSWKPKDCTIATKEEYEASQGISIEEAEERLGVKIKR
jgi:hypothetical protein